MANRANPDIGELEYSSSQCGGSSQCLESQPLSHVLFYAFLRWGAIVLILYSMILLNYFIIYKRKKDPSPLKHALNRTRGLGIMIFILFPIMFIIIFWIING